MDIDTSTIDPSTIDTSTPQSAYVSSVDMLHTHLISVVGERKALYILQYWLAVIGVLKPPARRNLSTKLSGGNLSGIKNKSLTAILMVCVLYYNIFLQAHSAWTDEPLCKLRALQNISGTLSVSEPTMKYLDPTFKESMNLLERLKEGDAYEKEQFFVKLLDYEPIFGFKSKHQLFTDIRNNITNTLIVQESSLCKLPLERYHELQRNPFQYTMKTISSGIVTASTLLGLVKFLSKLETPDDLYAKIADLPLEIQQAIVSCLVVPYEFAMSFLEFIEYIEFRLKDVGWKGCTGEDQWYGQETIPKEFSIEVTQTYGTPIQSSFCLDVRFYIKTYMLRLNDILLGGDPLIFVYYNPFIGAQNVEIAKFNPENTLKIIKRCQHVYNIYGKCFLVEMKTKSLLTNRKSNIRHFISLFNEENPTPIPTYSTAQENLALIRSQNVSDLREFYNKKFIFIDDEQFLKFATTIETSPELTTLYNHEISIEVTHINDLFNPINGLFSLPFLERNAE